MSVKRLVSLTGGMLIAAGVASSHAAILTFTDEAAFQGAVDALVSSGQAVKVTESFDAAPFGPVTDLLFGTPQPSVSSQGILWSPPVADGFVATSTGGFVSPSYQMFTVDSSGTRHPVPDGFTLTPMDPTIRLFAVGGWFNGTPLAKVGFTVDGDPNLVDLGNAAVLNNNVWTFLGFVQDDPALGFQTVDIRQIEEAGPETRIIFADSFTVAPSVVPLPPAFLLFLSGFSVIGILGRLRRRSAPAA